MTRIIIRAVPAWASTRRRQSQKYLERLLPEAEWCIDSRYTDPTLTGKQKSTLTFLAALRMAGDDPCVHMEDDVILTVDFRQKLEAVIEARPASIIQFFSMRKADREVGSRWDNAFMMNQCFYLPAGYSRLLADFHPTWERRIECPGGYDIMMQDWMRQRKERYWIHVPSLVEHREERSIAEPKRSPKRQSLTFEDPAE